MSDRAAELQPLIPVEPQQARTYAVGGEPARCGPAPDGLRVRPEVFRYLPDTGFGRQACPSELFASNRSHRDHTQGYESPTHALRRAGLEGHVLHARDETFPVSAMGTGWGPTPWHATQRAAWQAFVIRERRAD